MQRQPSNQVDQPHGQPQNGHAGNELHSTETPTSTSINQLAIYDMKPNQIPKNPRQKKSHAHALGRLPTLHNQIPTNEIKRRKVNRPFHSPPEIPARGAISLSGGTRKCGTGGYRLQAPKEGKTSGRTLRKTPRSPNPAVEMSGSPSLEMCLSIFPLNCM